MPANLTPDYKRAEDRFKAATEDSERIEALQEMLRTIPKHKGTEKLQADIKHRLSQLRKTAARAAAHGPDPFHIPRSGAGQVTLVGPPNSGKSLLVSRLTHAAVKVTDYPFGTALPIPGIAHFEDVPIELVDTPPVADGHVPAGLIGLVHATDIVAVVVDLAEDPLAQADLVLSMLASRNTVLRSSPRKVLAAGQKTGVIIANKSDMGDGETVTSLRELYSPEIDVLATSASTGEGLERLVARLWDLLGSIRVYTKQPGHEADLAKPFTLPVGSTVEDLARLIHRELPEKMKFARLWGHARFDGQQVHRTEQLRDKDVVEIHE
jgi:ribosome-interacting GTPase 1